MDRKIMVGAFAKRKAAGENIVMVTAYDAPFAALAAAAGIDIMLVGDSVATTVMGCSTTLPVTMEELIHHVKAVRRGAPNAFIVFDLPFLSYQVSEEEAMRNAGRALKEAGADAVKFEGGAEYAPLVRKMVMAGIPVMAHLGLLPQRIHAVGGYKVAGRAAEDADRLLADAKALEEAGAFAVVLECIPALLGKHITEALTIPTIGIGSGAECSGQVQVLHDVLGLLPGFTPKHAKHFAEIGDAVRTALQNYADAVRNGTFPGKENSFE